jgi:hypothetical protein
MAYTNSSGKKGGGRRERETKERLLQRSWNGNYGNNVVVTQHATGAVKVDEPKH